MGETIQDKETLRPSPTALLNPRMDPIFKAIFTQETKESYAALESFISSVLGRKIKDLKLTTNEPPVDNTTESKMSFDVSVTFDNGEKASIEMQGRNRDYTYEARSEIQVARLLNINAKKSNDWKAEKVYQISVLNFHLPKDDNSEMSWYTMKSQKGHALSGHLNVIYIDLLVLKELAGKPIENLTPLQKWGLYLAYADSEEMSDYIAEIAKSEKGIMEAKRIIGRMSLDDSNWFIQNSYDTAMRDYNDGLHNSEQRGIEKGRIEGAQQKAIEAATNLLKMNLLTVEQIAQAQGLTVEKVLELKAQIEAGK